MKGKSAAKSSGTEIASFDQLIASCYQSFMIDVRKLKAFIAVAEELNFHRAAEKLNTVQPALSRLVRALEEDVGVELLRRSTRHVELTEPGRVFLDEARGLIGQLSAMVRTTREVAAGRAGSLTLAYMDFAVHRLLPDFMSAVARHGPAIRVNLTYMSTAQQRIALTEGRADMGILIGGISNPNVDSIVVAEEPVVVALPDAHPLAGKRDIALRQVATERVVLGSVTDWAAFRDLIFDLYAEKGFVPPIAHEASSAAALMGLVAGNIGISFYAGVPRLYQGGGITFRPLRPKTLVPISVAWRKDAKLPLVRRVLKMAGWER
jgi:DNA-binding transcriptional LysR family regulator